METAVSQLIAACDPFLGEKGNKKSGRADC